MSAIDRAKQAWGPKAAVHSGGGQPAAPPDLSGFGVALKPEDEAQTGITAKHFGAFAEVAQEEGCVIVVRRTKAACLRWIKMDYPAKPPELDAVKTSPATGIVTCGAVGPEQGGALSFEEQVEYAWAAGHFVLLDAEADEGLRHKPGARVPGPMGRAVPLRAGGDGGGRSVLKAYRFGLALDQPFPRGLFERGQVIDMKSRLPLTGDYDLMGVFPVASPQSGRLVLIHDASAPASQKEQTPFGELLKPRTNPYVKPIIAKLNGRFGGRPRIMHGAHDLKFRPDVNNRDGCAVFAPGRAFLLPTAADVLAFYDAIGRNVSPPGPSA